MDIKWWSRFWRKWSLKILDFLRRIDVVTIHFIIFVTSPTAPIFTQVLLLLWVERPKYHSLPLCISLTTSSRRRTMHNKHDRLSMNQCRQAVSISFRPRFLIISSQCFLSRSVYYPNWIGLSAVSRHVPTHPLLPGNNIRLQRNTWRFAVV